MLVDSKKSVFGFACDEQDHERDKRSYQQKVNFVLRHGNCIRVSGYNCGAICFDPHKKFVSKTGDENMNFMYGGMALLDLFHLVGFERGELTLTEDCFLFRDNRLVGIQDCKAYVLYFCF